MEAEETTNTTTIKCYIESMLVERNLNKEMGKYPFALVWDKASVNIRDGVDKF